MTDYHNIYRQFISGRMGAFYKTFYSQLLLYAAGILGERLSFMAEDCVQNAVLTTYLHRDELEDMEKWRGWLIKSVRNNALMQLRGEEQRLRYERHGLMSQDEAEDIYLATIEQEVYTELFAAIESLPEKYRQIFDLCFSSGMKNIEVAELLNIAEITVKKRKAKMIALLREKLGKNIDEAYLLLILHTCTSFHFLYPPLS